MADKQVDEFLEHFGVSGMRRGQRKHQARIDRSVRKPPSAKELQIKKGAMLAESVLNASGRVTLSSVPARSLNINIVDNVMSVGAVL